jgi:hypothetical protein
MWNKQLSKEEYNHRLAELDLTDYKIILELKKNFKELYLKSLHRFAIHIKTVNSIGDNLEGTKNCKFCFDAKGNIEDCKYSHWLEKDVKDGYDSGPGIGLAELTYEIFDTGIGNYRNLFTSVVYSSNEIEYCFNCYGCSNLFGCLGLRNKKYCILNKQYSKDEYEKLVSKIKQQMMNIPYVDKNKIIYKYGEFFPVELSPFAYNETVAQDYFPKTKEKILKEGYKWRERQVNEYKATIKAKDLPDKLNDVSDEIIREIIECENVNENNIYCRKAFKVIEDELNLYKKLKVPLPHLCFFCRHRERLKMRNPMKLWHRKCMCDKTSHFHGNNNCDIEFETSYSPDRPEIIYCEKCYQQEVY